MEICMGFLHQFSMVMYKSVLIVCRNVVDLFNGEIQVSDNLRWSRTIIGFEG